MNNFIQAKNLKFSYINEMEEPPVKTEVLNIVRFTSRGLC